jgi:uncharacterized protein YndB with AHSA1/START domain
MQGFSETADSSAGWLELSGIVDASPHDVYAAFIDPDLIVRWWSEEATTDPVVGGAIEARWPSTSWAMRGVYTELDPGRTVSFTWKWDHEPDTPERTVRVQLDAADGGTRITLAHGAYQSGEAEDRQGHLEGWQHFLPRLALVAGS